MWKPKFPPICKSHFAYKNNWLKNCCRHKYSWNSDHFTLNTNESINIDETIEVLSIGVSLRFIKFHPYFFLSKSKNSMIYIANLPNFFRLTFIKWQKSDIVKNLFTRRGANKHNKIKPNFCTAWHSAFKSRLKGQEMKTTDHEWDLTLIFLHWFFQKYILYSSGRNHFDVIEIRLRVNLQENENISRRRKTGTTYGLVKNKDKPTLLKDVLFIKKRQRKHANIYMYIVSMLQ